MGGIFFMKKVLIITGTILLSLFLVACGGTETPVETSVDSIDVVFIGENQEVFIDDFDFNDYELLITYTDGTQEQIVVTEDMIDSLDIDKLLVEGTHEITLNYHGDSTTFNINLIKQVIDDRELNQSLLAIFNAGVQAGNIEDMTFEEWLETVHGPQGEDGREVLLQVSNGYIQWQYVGETSWNDLVDLVTLTGPIGTDGEDGREVLFQVSEGYIQWQYTGDETWSNVIDLDTLTGVAGTNGEDGREVVFQVANGYIQWQYVGETSWNDLVDITTLIGAQGVAGKEVQFQVSEGYIQWQYTGDTSWTNLIEIATLVGDTGLGIRSTEINQLGELIITYTDDSIANIGQIYVVYTVIFRGINGEVLDVQNLLYGEDSVAPTDPLVEGYTFLSWDIEFTNVTTNLEVNAVFDINTYTVTFDSQGGDVIAPIADVEYNSTVTLPTPTRENYEFMGWYLGTSVNDQQFTNEDTIDKDVTLYARWENVVYLVSFFDFDGDFLTIKEVYKGQDVTAPYVYRLGYTHSGWDKELTNVQNNMIVYAQYTPIVYNVYYYNLFDGVAPETNPTSYTIEDYFVLQEPTRFGYTFTGWQNGWGGSIISYLYGDVGTKYLYATWEINSHNINYNIDDYDVAYSDSYLEYGETIIDYDLNNESSIYLTSNNRVLVNGVQYSYALGFSSTEPQYELLDITHLIPLEEGDYITDVVLGSRNMLVIAQSGKIYMWGSNGSGQIPFTSNSLLPTDITSYINLYPSETIVEVYNAFRTYYILTSEDRLIGWGTNYNGELLSTESTTINTPVDLTESLGLLESETIAQFFPGEYGSSVLTSTGRVLYWGQNQYGEAFIPGPDKIYIPVDITSYIGLNEGETVAEVMRGRYFTIIRTSDDRFIGAGTNYGYQLGYSTPSMEFSPADITSHLGLNEGEFVEKIDVTAFATLIYTSNGRVLIMGDFNENVVDFSDNFDLKPRETIESITNIGGSYFVLTSLNNVYSWGMNSSGHLADGTANELLVPTLIHFRSFTEHIVMSYDYAEGISEYLPVKTGYTFNGWFTDPEMTQAFTLTNMPNNSFELYGKWSLDEYNINYNLGEGEVNNISNPDTYTVEDATILLGTPSKTGYNFTGWYIGGYGVGDVVTSLDTQSSINYDLYPSWEPAIYTVNYTIYEDYATSFESYLNPGELVIFTATDYGHTGSITNTGRVFTWGMNNDGQLGIGTTVYKYTPQDITANFNLAEGETIVSLSFGWYFSSALSSEGRVFTWGRGTDGRIGDGTLSDSYLPNDITANFNLAEGETITSIAVSDTHVLALSSDNNIFAWGQNDFGELGNNSSGTDITLPVNITANFLLDPSDKIIKVAAGYSYSAAVTELGELYMWGNAMGGRLTTGFTTVNINPLPIHVSASPAFAGLADIVDVELVNGSTFIITLDSKVFVCGVNNEGQLGIGTTVFSWNMLEATSFYGLEAGEEIVRIDGGQSHVAILTSNDRMLIWGDNQFGQLGSGDYVDVYQPNERNDAFDLIIGETITGFDLGNNTTTVYTSLGRMFIFGYSRSGQYGLGVATDIQSNTPVEIPFLNYFERSGTQLIQFMDPIEITLIREDYEIDTWYYDQARTLPVDISSMPSSDITIYASWKGIEYTINYELNGGTNDSENPLVYSVASGLDMLPASKAGYTFVGWYTNPEFTGNEVTNTVDLIGDATIYAKFETITYTITYIVDFGINPETNPTTYTAEDDTIVLEDPTNGIFTFDGWYDNPAYTGDPITEILSNSYGDLILFAKWILV